VSSTYTAATGTATRQSWNAANPVSPSHVPSLLTHPSWPPNRAEFPLQWLGECLIHQSILYEGNPDRSNIRDRFVYKFEDPKPQEPVPEVVPEAVSEAVPAPAPAAPETTLSESLPVSQPEQPQEQGEVTMNETTESHTTEDPPPAQAESLPQGPTPQEVPVVNGVQHDANTTEPAPDATRDGDTEMGGTV
jgi:hypothetical protein